MARGTYAVTLANATLANQAVSLVFLNPGTTVSFEVLRCWVSQAANATSAQQRVQLNTQVTAFPTLVSNTPVQTSIIDQVSKLTGNTTGAAGTCGVNASGEGGGAKTVIQADSFNVLNGWLWVPTPPETILMSAGGSSGFGLVFPAAPTTLTGWNFGVIYREW